MKRIAVTLLLSLTSIARAQTLDLPLPPLSGNDSFGEDVLTLRDGTVLHGRVALSRPGDRVEMLLIDGRTQVVAWDDIVSKVGPSFPSERKRPGSRYLQPSEGRVPLQIDAPRAVAVGVLRTRPTIGQESMTFSEDLDVSQMVMDFQSRTGVVVCTATPCRIYARPGPLKLQVSGDNVLSYSAELTVPPNGANLKLRSPDYRQRQMGSTLLGMSIPLLIVGAVFTPVGTAWDKKSAGSATWEGTWYGLGSAMLAGGVCTLITGIVMAVKNRRGIESLSPLSAMF